MEKLHTKYYTKGGCHLKIKMTKSAMDNKNLSILERVEKLEEETRELRNLLSSKEVAKSSEDGSSSEKEKARECAITELFHKIGIPANIKGYNYTRTAIMLALEDATYLECITKALYPTVAKMYNTTSSRAERAIRHAIECAWNRGDVDALQELFGYTVQARKGKTTNSEFISLIVDKLKLKGI